MTLAEKQHALVEELSLFDDAHDRLTVAVDRSKRVPPLPAAERTEAHRVLGCVSTVWLVPEVRDGVCRFRADAESPLVRGLVLLLTELFDGATAAEIAGSDADPLEALGLTRNLSPTRRNGLAAVRSAILAFARRHAGA